MLRSPCWNPAACDMYRNQPCGLPRRLSWFEPRWFCAPLVPHLLTPAREPGQEEWRATPNYAQHAVRAFDSVLPSSPQGAHELEPHRESQRFADVPGVKPRDFSASGGLQHLPRPRRVPGRRVRPRDPLVEVELERREPHALEREPARRAERRPRARIDGTR